MTIGSGEKGRGKRRRGAKPQKTGKRRRVTSGQKGVGRGETKLRGEEVSGITAGGECKNGKEVARDPRRRGRMNGRAGREGEERKHFRFELIYCPFLLPRHCHPSLKNTIVLLLPSSYPIFFFLILPS